MADETTVRFLYPQNFVGTFDKYEKGHLRYIVQCTSISDGTGEAETIKVRRTDLRNTDGDTPKALIIEKIEYQIQSAANTTGVAGPRVNIEYDNTNSDLVAVLQRGEGCLDFSKHGGFRPTVETEDGQLDLGNIIFNTEDCYANDTYTITLHIRVSSK